MKTLHCNSKILISHQIFNCTFSIFTCNLKNLIFLNHETFMLASSSDSSYKACMRVCAYLKNSKCKSKTQISQPSHQFHDQFKHWERERERERNLERSETSSFRWAERDSWSLSRIFSLLKSHTKLWKRKKTKEKRREPERMETKRGDSIY